ncbi:MAG TPA: XRE family transcriptional regulator [Desulfocapsa sulfexigens]|nr:XRE family transcriptional regulator [Desulfocapsa sulfexigens]
MNHYSTILTEGRAKAKLSRRAVAKKADISEAHLRFIEKAERETKPATLRKLALAIGLDEQPLMESWLAVNMPGMDYSDLAARLPQGIDVQQLEEMYQIPAAKKIYEESKRITASQVKSLPASDIFKIRTALQNCLGMIQELETT